METKKIAFAVIYLALLVTHLSEAQNCSQPQKGILDGEVILGLLFPFHSSEDGKCISSISDVDTIQILEAAKFAVSRFNQRYSIPGLRIGLEAWDSCRSEEIAVERSLLFLGDRVNVIDSNGDVCPNRKLRIGMVADEISSTSRAVASLLTNAWTPQISYGGTAPDLSDKEKYPYLLRTVPSDKYQAQAMVDVAKRIGWKYVNVIYTEEDDHQRAFQAFKDIAGEQGICFANEHGIKQKTTVLAAFESFLADFSRKPNAKAVVAFVTQEHAGYLLKAAQENGHLDLQWFFSYEGMTNPIVLIQGAPLAARGMMGMAPAIFTVNVQDFDDYFRSLTPETVSTESNPWFAEYWQEKYQCNLPGSSKYPSQCDQTAVDSHSSSYISYPYIPTTLNAIDTFSSVVRDLHDSLCGINHAGVCDEMLTVDSDELLQKLKQVTLQATDNMMEVNFDENGDIAPIYDIANYNGSVFSLVGNWTSGILSLDVSKVTMWVGDDPKTGSDLPVSECGSPCTDSQCETAEEKKVYIPGDVILGGIFPIHGKGSSDQDCGTLDAEGVIQLEAMLFALEQIN
ncbi:metabotropic glutamate receptor 3-like [Ptychodera flava]|uniref:metabotropic glutamate receptor 3-like n=1 Tax=Ptychodera flava TaxID=63121 RepID=UPI00396A3AB3